MVTIRRIIYGISHINLEKIGGIQIQDEQLGEKYSYKGFTVYENEYCDCCEKCMAVIGKTIYFPSSARENNLLIEKLKVQHIRHDIFTLHDGEKIVYHDNILSFFK